MNLSTPHDERDTIARAIEATNRRWQATLDTVLDGIITINDTGTIEMVNATVESLFGYKPDELLGRNIRLLMPEPYEAQHDEYLSRYRETKVRKVIGIGRTVEGRRKDGSRFPIHLSVGEAKIDGRTVYTGIIHDLSEITRAYAELERAAQAKDEFLASMSHELRTPLNAILGLSEALSEGVYGPLNDEQRRTLSTVDDSGRHLLALINDILDMAKINAGHLVIETEPVSLFELCQMSLASVRPQAARKQISLAVTEVDPSLVVETDARRLRQVLINLLNNAVKFTPEGGRVILEVRLHADAGVLEFAVEDTGIGIPASRLGEIFEPFRQIDTKLSRSFEGSGLGLALVVKLVEAFGGSLSVDSLVGKGSRFSVQIPGLPSSAGEARAEGQAVSPAKSVPVLDKSPEAKERLTVMLAEDNEASAKTVSDYLQRNGIRVVIARSGIEAVEIAAKESLNAILMDIQMPELDGLEAIRLIRSRKSEAQVPIIALTALAMPGDRERCLAAGADAYLAKPVRLTGLLLALNKATEGISSA